MTAVQSPPEQLVDPPVRRRRHRWTATIFPVAVVLIFLALVAGNLNGSSIGYLDTVPGADPSLLHGQPRSVRADEWSITTPMAVMDTRQDFTPQPYVGLVRAQQETVTHGGPIAGWVEVFKPQDWGYLALGAHRGLAVHWWLPFLVSLLGVFWLLRSLRAGPVLAAALAVVATMTPYNAWWSAPAPSLLQGYAALAAVAVLAGLRSGSRRVSFAWGLASGVMGTALFLMLYPPWMIPLALVVAGLGVGYAVDVRAGIGRVLLVLAGTCAVALPALGAWYVGAREGITATAETFYPGQRYSVPGEATFSWLLSAPFNSAFAGRAGATLDPARSGIRYTNLSEISASWLPLPILLAAVAVMVLRRRRPVAVDAAVEAEAGWPPAPGRWTAVGIAAMTVLILAWGLLPLPDWTGTLVMERVKGTRLPVSLGFAAVLLVAIASGSRPRGRPRVWEGALWTVAVGGTVALSFWAEGQMPWNDAVVSTKHMLLWSGLLAVGFGLVAAGWVRRSAALLLACFAAWSWSLVNPLYHGLGPLDHDPVVRALRPVAEPGTRAMVFGDTQLVALVRGAGMQSLGGYTPYPDSELMQRLMPTQRGLWNNYAQYWWKADPAAERPRIKQINGTSMELTLNPCDPRILALGPTWAVSKDPITAPCLQLRKTVPSGRLTRYVYAVVPAAP